MLLAIPNMNEIGFDQLLIAILAFNALVMVVLTFMPGLHRRLAHWIWPKGSRNY